MLRQRRSLANKGKVLVVGGGPAGSATAFWLARAGFEVVVAERSTRQPYGQGIDITHEAVEVTRRMGLLDKIKANTTGEAGFSLLDDKGYEIASVGANGPSDSPKLPSPTNEIEIMRGTLTTIFADAAKDEGVEYRYGCTITSMKENEASMTAVLSDTSQPEDFTAVIGADGIYSKVRRLALGDEVNEKCFRPTNTYNAFFSMNAGAKPMRKSVFQHANKGRGIWMRPIDREGTRVSTYLIVTSPHYKELQDAVEARSEQQQRAAIEKVYEGVGGICDQAIQGMHEAEDFYFTRISQIQLDSWHVGRCALVGDAGYCPSPLSGQGLAISILGSYILAGELSKNPGDPAAAFIEYKKRFEPYVKSEGKIPFGGYMPRIAEPQSNFGIWMLRTLFWFACNPTTQRIYASLPAAFQFGGEEEKSQTEPRIPLPPFGFEVA